MGSVLQAAAVFTALHTQFNELKADEFLEELKKTCNETEPEIYGY